MSNLIWRLNDLSYPDCDGRPENVPFIEQYEEFRDSLTGGSWQIVEIWDEGVVLYAIAKETFWAVSLDFIDRVYNEPTPPNSLPGGGPRVVFESLIAGPDIRQALQIARGDMQDRNASQM